MVHDKGIQPRVPVWDKTERNDDGLSSSDFQWDATAEEYRCPEGHALRDDRRVLKVERARITKAGTLIYRASKRDCITCAMKPKC